MNVRGKELTTPNPRAVPSSAVKDVEESRQQRLQRQQSRFRDRGGIFVPTNRNTLADILLGRKELSPMKTRRSRSRSCSPEKPPASPTAGKGKRVSIASSTALAIGNISVASSTARRSPRKKATSSKPVSNENQKKQGSRRKKRDGTATPDPGQLEPPVSNSNLTRYLEPVARSRKAKKTVTADNEGNDKPVEKSAKKAARNAKTSRPTKATRSSKAVGKNIEDNEPTRELSAVSSEEHGPPLPPKSRRQGSRTPSSKGVEGTDDEPPAPPPQTKPKSGKRKLSIVQEEEEEKAGESYSIVDAGSQKPASRSSYLSPEPVRKKAKTTAPAFTGASKEAFEPKAKVADANSKAKTTPKAKLPSKEVPPPVPSPSPGPPKNTKVFSVIPEPPESSDEMSEPRTKVATSKTKGRTMRKGQISDHPKAIESSSAHSRGKRRATSQPAEIDRRSKKKAKILPLQEVDEHQAGLTERTKRPKTSKSSQKPASSQSRLQKENTPVSDCSESRAAKNKARTKPPSIIKGPRKSVMIRMKEPLPPIEDNEPDPIDFLS